MTPSDFRELRERLGLSCARIAGRYGVAPITVSRFERGISDPDANPSGAKWQPMRAVEWMRRIADRRGAA